MIVKPVPGRKVRHPFTRRHVPDEGMEVPETDPYWVRKLADGDVVEVTRGEPPALPPDPSVKE